VCRGNTNDGSKAGRAGIATGAKGSSNAVRGNVSDVGDIWGDFRRKNVEIGVLNWISASCNHVSLPRLDNLPFGEDLSPRGARVRGEDSGEVEGAYRGISIYKTHVKRLVQECTLFAFSVSSNDGRLAFLGSCMITETIHVVELGTEPTRSVCAYRVSRIRRVSAFAVARDPGAVYINQIGTITPIAVGGDEDVCAGGGILLGRVLPLVVDVGGG
jgi:hypothetical protein